MAMIIMAAVVFLIFYLTRRHIGATLLAMLAGMLVYDLAGGQLTEWLAAVPVDWLAGVAGTIVYVVLVIGLPMVLYFQSAGGTWGMMRIIEAAMAAILTTTLLMTTLREFVAFDEVSNQIVAAVNSMRGVIYLAGAVSAYLDILFLARKD